MSNQPVIYWVCRLPSGPHQQSGADLVVTLGDEMYALTPKSIRDLCRSLWKDVTIRVDDSMPTPTEHPGSTCISSIWHKGEELNHPVLLEMGQRSPSDMSQVSLGGMSIAGNNAGRGKTPMAQELVNALRNRNISMGHSSLDEGVLDSEKLRPWDDPQTGCHYSSLSQQKDSTKVLFNAPITNGEESPDDAFSSESEEERYIRPRARIKTERGPETPMSTILSEGIKYNRKLALIKEKGGAKDKSKDQSFVQKVKQTLKPPQREYYPRQAKTNHKVTGMRPPRERGNSQDHPRQENRRDTFFCKTYQPPPPDKPFTKPDERKSSNYIDPEKWNTMTPDERSKILEQRKKKTAPKPTLTKKLQVVKKH
ncbi:uncharacterized [Tachysurus ichikawai]